MVTSAAPYYTLRAVRFESAEDFIDEVRPHDGPFMSATLGFAMDYVASAAQRDPRSTPTKFQERGTFHAIYEHDRPVLVLVHTPLRPTTHFIGYPAPPPPPLLSSACALLAKTTAPSSLAGHLAGPRDALAAFLAHLPALRVSPPLRSALACTATLRTLPPADPSAPPAPARYLLRPGTPQDAPSLLPLAQELLARTPTGCPPPARLLADLRAAAARTLLFVAAAVAAPDPDPDATPAGYVLLGSATPRTVWIRHVIVHAAHRRRGLAARLVGAVTRACLGAPAGEGGGVGVPGCGVKSAVCLLFDDPGAGRVYGRCGFAVVEGGADPGTGEQLCYAYEVRAVEGP